MVFVMKKLLFAAPAFSFFLAACGFDPEIAMNNIRRTPPDGSTYMVMEILGTASGRIKNYSFFQHTPEKYMHISADNIDEDGTLDIRSAAVQCYKNYGGHILPINSRIYIDYNNVQHNDINEECPLPMLDGIKKYTDATVKAAFKGETVLIKPEFTMRDNKADKSQ